MAGGSNDPFDEVLNMESNLIQAAYQEGRQAGRAMVVEIFFTS
jgi:hypothetical protein